MLRSNLWFAGQVDHTFEHLSSMRAMGHIPSSFLGKPIIGVFNSWNDLNNCNLPHKQLVDYVKRGVLLAGGYPIEIHTITTPADFMKNSDLPYRNLMSIDVEEMIRSLPLDGAVLLSECDKTTPAQLMAVASCNIPALQLAAGHRTSAYLRGKPVNYGTDLWKYIDEYQAGHVSDSEWKLLERSISCSLGGCPVMGTASTMKSLSEILGMMLPGTASIPANHSSRYEAAERTGSRIVEMVQDQLRPSDLMTESAFNNAIKMLAAIGGSTNAVLHLTAIAGRLGIDLNLDTFDRLTSDVPLLVNLQPSGEHNMDDYHIAGGTAGTIHNLLPLLDGQCLTAEGKTLTEVYKDFEVFNTAVIQELDNPFKKESGIRVLRGNLIPNGAIIKKSTVSEKLTHHVGKAVVFENYEDMQSRIHDDNLEVDAESILVLRNCGPVAAGMPEWGQIPIPKKLLREGVRDMVRISDARMSGTSYGTVILHAAPESAIGGPLAIVQDGDRIEFDLKAGVLNLLLTDGEIQDRLSKHHSPVLPHRRGYPRLHQDHVLQANEGCDLDFLRPSNPSEQHFVYPVVGRS